MRLFSMACVAASAVVCVCLGAQAVAAEDLGFEAGAGISSFSANLSTTGLSSHVGPILGVFVDSTVFGAIRLETGIRYLQEGFANGAFSEVGHYLSVPVVLKAKLPLDLPLTPYLLLGPDLEVLLHTDSPSPDGTIPLYSVDLMLDAGAGVEFELGDSARAGDSLKGFVQFRYSFGLTYANNSADSPVYDLAGTWQNFEITGGLVFPL